MFWCTQIPIICGGIGSTEEKFRFCFSKTSYPPDTCGRGLSVFLSKSLILSVVYLHPRLSSIFQLLPFVVLFQLLRRKIQVEKAAGVTTEGEYTLI